jgi:WXG100 family type VII secretion target
MSSYTLIKARIVQLENGWHGDAQKALRQKYEEQEPILKRHTDQLNQFAQLLQKTANEMEQMDLDLTRFFQQY